MAAGPPDNGADRTVTIAILLMLAAAALSSVLHAGVRFLSTHLPVFEIVFLRAVMSIVTVAPLVFRPGQSAWRSNAPSLHLLRGAVGAVSMTAWYYALSTLPLADAVTLGLTTTFFVVIGAWLWFGENVDAGRWMAVVVGFAGAVLVLQPTGENVRLVPALIAVASSALWAVSLLLAKHQARYDSSLTITFYQPLTIAPYAAVGAYLVWVPPSLIDLAVLTLLGVTASLGNYCAVHALRLADASITMPVDYTKIVWTVIAGYLLFNEVPGLATVVGAVVIVAAAVFIAVRERVARRGPAQARP